MVSICFTSTLLEKRILCAYDMSDSKLGVRNF